MYGDVENLLSEAYEQKDVWSGIAIGGSFEALRDNPDIFLADIMQEVNQYPADKAAHFFASYSISRATMKGVDYFDDNAGLKRKTGAAFLTTNLFMGAWEYSQAKNGAADPYDIGFNNLGVMAAAAHEYLEETAEAGSLENIEEELEPRG